MKSDSKSTPRDIFYCTLHETWKNIEYEKIIVYNLNKEVLMKKLFTT